MRIRSLAAFALAGVLALSACGGDDDAADREPAAEEPAADATEDADSADAAGDAADEEVAPVGAEVSLACGLLGASDVGGALGGNPAVESGSDDAFVEGESECRWSHPQGSYALALRLLPGTEDYDNLVAAYPERQPAEVGEEAFVDTSTGNNVVVAAQVPDYLITLTYTDMDSLDAAGRTGDVVALAQKVATAVG